MLTKAAAARLLEVDPTQVARWVARGMPLTSEKRVREWHAANVRTRRGAVPDDDAGVQEPRNWRERRDKALALTEELNLAERKGELIDRKVVMATWGGLVASFRARMLAIPSKVAPQIAGPGKVQHVEDLIAAAVHEALAEVAGDGLPNAR
jgi:phage terminase Nu1 subunit (DNA packaging protein)